jgi:hypothetical protein
VVGDLLAIAGEPVGGSVGVPAALLGEPVRRREVVVGEDGCDAALVAGGEHPAVVVELGPGEPALLGLDPRPLDRQAVGVEPCVGEELDVLGVAVVTVAGIARGLGEERVGGPLGGPHVGGAVPAFDLVAGGGGSPEEPFGEGHRCIVVGAHEIGSGSAIIRLASGS